METKNKIVRDGYVFYRSFYVSMKNLKPNMLKKLFIVINEYALNGELIESDNYISSLFELIKPQIDANNKRYQNSLKAGAPKGTVNNPLGNNQYKSNKGGKSLDNQKSIIIQNGSSKGKPRKKKTNQNDKEEYQEDNIISSSLTGNPIISLPLNVSNTYKPIYESDISYYSGLYPNVDILQEFKNMLGWLNASPNKRKTARGIDKFINSWLCKKQDSYSGKKTASISAPSKNSLSIEDMQYMKGALNNK